MLVWAITATALLLLLAAAVSDVYRRLIPDWVSAGLLALGAAVLMVGARAPAPMDALASSGLMFAGGAGLFFAGCLGGGDVKLMTALGLWTGIAGLPQFLLFTSLAGGLLSLVCLAVALVEWRRSGERPALREIEIPYGLAIAAAGTPVVLASL